MASNGGQARTKNTPDTSIPDKHYRRSPVVEALCEVYFVDSKWDNTLPGKFAGRIEGEYPEPKELQQVEAAVNVSPLAQGAQFQVRGTRTQFFNNDKSRIIQLEKDLIVVNQLRPYLKFRKWRPVIDTMVRHYNELAHPKGIKRIGMRYINEIELPPIPLHMQDYFRIYPQLPSEMGGEHGRFMLRLDIPPHHRRHELVISFVLKTVKRNEPTHFMLDLYDIIVAEDIFSLDQLEGLVGEAHENIVLAFENSLTEKTKGMFEEER
jgi:uncharacterized protein (TIGR04255 family)